MSDFASGLASTDPAFTDRTSADPTSTDSTCTDPAADSYLAICSALSETFGVEPAELRPEATFEELEVDSLALLEFAIVMSERLGVSGGDADLRPSMTLGEAAAIVEELRSQAGGTDRAAPAVRTATG